MDTISLAKNMLTAATGAAKGHAKDLENYLKARVKLIADGTAEIAADRLKKKITKADAKFAFDEIRESEKTARPGRRGHEPCSCSRRYQRRLGRRRESP